MTMSRTHNSPSIDLAAYGDSNLQGEASILSEQRSSFSASLDDVIPGVPGQDYPIFGEAPATRFSCDGKAVGGYYADAEASCQSFHICIPDLTGNMAAHTFLCPNGTVFNADYFICDWWFNVDCTQADAISLARNEDLLLARAEADARLAAAASTRVETIARGYGAPVQEASEVIEVRAPQRAYGAPTLDSSASAPQVRVAAEPASGSYRAGLV